MFGYEFVKAIPTNLRSMVDVFMRVFARAFSQSAVVNVGA
jgi:hypothetical protein